MWGLLDGNVLTGDCIEVMRSLPPNSVDAVITDPPYGIGFMGHEWDQPGKHAPVRSAGKPGLFASGKSYPGEKVVGGLKAQTPEQRKRGKRSINRTRDGAMEAGRYDLSLTANQLFQEWCEAWASECLRVLKPGGHMLVSGGTRTSHRLTAGIEDAGFEIRDSLMWLYGSGFPKSLDVAKAIDKAQGVEGDWRQEDHPGRAGVRKRENSTSNFGQTDYGAEGNERHVYEPASDDALRWAGWGTALKPSWEPIIVARKPLEGTVAGNVLAHGTGGINVDGCRIGLNGDQKITGGGKGLFDGGKCEVDQTIGRWPSNVALGHTEDCRMIDADHGETFERWACVAECPVRMLDDQTGELVSGANPTQRTSDKFDVAYGDFAGARDCEPARGANRGGASRFFYCAKASRAERNAGLDGFTEQDGQKWKDVNGIGHTYPDGTPRPENTSRNFHPTVKPVDLMRWLVRLVTPPEGIVLDPFAGSGTTGCAAALEGFDFVGIERDAEYAGIAEARIRWWAAHPEGVETERVFASEKRRAELAAAGQEGLF